MWVAAGSIERDRKGDRCSSLKEEHWSLGCREKKEKLEETKNLGKADNINVIAADVACENGRETVIQAVKRICPNNLNYVIHNAGMMGPISKAMDIDPKSWQQTFALNVDAPLFLNQKLVPEMPEGSRILHVGSGAAHNPYDGWTAYCSTKAAFFMMYQCLRGELAPKGIAVGSLKPGIVETEMQETIRKADVDEMADVGRFKEFKEKEYKAADKAQPHKPPTDGLDSVENVAHFVDFLLLQMDKEEYSKAEHDIRDSSHHDRWIK
eukprot:CAMPEP_0203787786 /NCGR_PEP_ID=MMETSP0100_2-20121128/2450_1 /ASSEMBLY_ACC=CAM_ASM_000210 /TAXON_ID=96639 /ORGANISM=" , Strain NY0313808BC1" /LENGTH=265 /DNA_ID=CAMNT_0050690387 /DNA_START=73 /DNA_END=871 /DNA_ORIENTATION=-